MSDTKSELSGSDRPRFAVYPMSNGDFCLCAWSAELESWVTLSPQPVGILPNAYVDDLRELVIAPAPDLDSDEETLRKFRETLGIEDDD